MFVPIEIDTRDVSGALNSKVEILKDMPNVEVRVKRLKPKFGIIGPMFKGKAKEVVKAVEELSDEDKLKLFEGKTVVVSVDGSEIEVKPEWFDIEIEKFVRGENVEVLETANTVILVEV